MTFDDLFPVVVACDDEATIELTLASLREFRELIVLDCGSRDRTREICRAYPNVHVVAGESSSGGRARNLAASLAEGDWIFALDPGEFASDALLASLRTLELGDPDLVYTVCRHTLLMGREMRWGGWGSEWLARVYNRHRYQFDTALIDEKLVLAADTRLKPLRGRLWREAAPTLDVLVRDIGVRASLRQRGAARSSGPAMIAMRSAWAFFVSYVLKLGLLEGWRGLVIAAATASEIFFRLMQRYASQFAAASRSAADPRR